MKIDEEKVVKYIELVLKKLQCGKDVILSPIYEMTRLNQILKSIDGEINQYLSYDDILFIQESNMHIDWFNITSEENKLKELLKITKRKLKIKNI
jgi:predicted phosphatase